MCQPPTAPEVAIAVDAPVVACLVVVAAKPEGERGAHAVMQRKTRPGNGTDGTVGAMSQPKAMNLRFPDPAQRAAIQAAAKQEGVSLQEYILSAAYTRATAVEERFLDSFKASMSHSGEAFTEDASPVDPGEEQRTAELSARHDLEEQLGRDHAA